MSGHHGHGPQGAAGSRSNRTRLGIALAITLAVLLAQVAGALLTGSLALLVDSAHVLTDAAGLVMAVIAAVLAGRPATDRHTWGLLRAEVLAATAQALVLLGVGLYVVVEGIRRLVEPPQIDGAALLVFGVLGLVGNLAAMAVLASERGANLNMRAAFLEVVNDALGSVAVILSAVAIQIWGWNAVDTVAALVIGAMILPRAWRILQEGIGVLLESTPADLDLDAVRQHILGLEHVREVHDLHASQIATGLPVLTAHVVVDDECFHDGRVPRLLGQLQACVAEHFPVSVEHSTFQVEPASHRETLRHG
jgi:cobalt-zinc-cadmium efflux system protein